MATTPGVDPERSARAVKAAATRAAKKAAAAAAAAAEQAAGPPEVVEAAVVAERPPRVRAARTRKTAAPAPVASQPVDEPVVEPVDARDDEPTEPVEETAAPRTPARRAARTAPPRLDPMGAGAVEEARAAAVEVAGADQVGEHLGVTAETDRVTVHRFATTHPGYRGWAWTVVLARVPRARAVTVSEVVLLPGEQALLAPSWVPWADRVEPGDLGETDVLPFRDDDPLLDEGLEQVPDGFDQAFSGDETALVWELGLGRRRVLNREGRIEAATRWYRSDNGPDNAETRAADAPCSTCGYLVGMTGTFRQSFGVCANAWSPEDGRVVSMDHGCGAHSETGQTLLETDELPEPLIDDLRQDLDTEPLPADAPEPRVTETEPGAQPVAVGGTGAEDARTL